MKAQADAVPRWPRCSRRRSRAVGFAFAARNTVTASKAGDGSGAVSGYTVTGVSWDLNDTSPQYIDKVTFNLGAAATEVKARVKKSDGSYYAWVIVLGDDRHHVQLHLRRVDRADGRGHRARGGLRLLGATGCRAGRETSRPAEVASRHVTTLGQTAPSVPPRASLAVAALWWFLAPPQLGGRTAWAVVEGTLDGARLGAGDLVIVRARPSYDVDDVVLFESETLARRARACTGSSASTSAVSSPAATTALRTTPDRLAERRRDRRTLARDPRGRLGARSGSGSRCRLPSSSSCSSSRLLAGGRESRARRAAQPAAGAGSTSVPERTGRLAAVSPRPASGRCSRPLWPPRSLRRRWPSCRGRAPRPSASRSTTRTRTPAVRLRAPR